MSIDQLTGSAGQHVVAILTAIRDDNRRTAGRIGAALNSTERLAALAFAVGVLSKFVDDGTLDLESIGLRAAQLAGEP